MGMSDGRKFHCSIVIRLRLRVLTKNKLTETALAKGFSFNTGDAKYLYVCRRMKLPGRGVYSL